MLKTVGRKCQRALSCPQRDERGNLIVLLSVVLVLVTLSSLLVALVVGNQEIINGRQTVYSGVTGANAGLSDALFRLDQGASDTGTGGVMCLNPGDSNCGVNASGVSQLTGIKYVARTVPAGTAASQASEWIVQAIGNAASGFHGAVQETLTRSSKYPFALFGKQALTFTGDTTAGTFGTFNPGPPGTGSFTPCSNTVSTPACLAIGSDGSISCSGPSPAGVAGIIYATGNGGGSDSCGTASSQNSIYQVPDPSPPSGALPCPWDGNLGSGYGHPTISPGAYVCNETVNISGSLMDSSTTDPVQLYIMTGNSVSNFLHVVGGSQINTTIPFGSLTPSGPPAGSTMPTTQLFQVFSNSNGNLISDGNSSGFIFAGIMYAPDAYLTNNGCKSSFLGTVTINTYTCHGDPNLSFWYDSSLGYDFGPWVVSDYQQINPSSVNIP